MVRQFIVTVKCLTELINLSYDEFTYFVPLIKDEKSAQIISNIKLYRENKIKLDEIIYNRLMQISNYQFTKNYVLFDEDLICLVGMNRKSRSYDKPYYKLYENIKNIFIDGGNDYESLLISAKKNQSKTRWRNLIFKTTNLRTIEKLKQLNEQCPFLNCETEQDFKKYL